VPELEDKSPLFRFAEPPGPCAVGLRVVEHYDESRVWRHATDACGQPYSGERARPLQTLVWYPARSSGAKCMTVRDYAALWATETHFDAPKLPARAREWVAAMTPSLDMPLWARRDADELPERFPVVIYAPSFGSVAWENADLCEYLASHGFVVLASPSIGAMTRNMTADLAGIDAQARDLSFLVGYARTLAITDCSRVAVAGFSWGGLANVFAASRDSRIGALVALDGSLRYWPGMVKLASDVHPSRLTVPLLSLAKGDWTLEEQARFLSPAQLDGPNVLNAWTHGDLCDVHMLGMTHRQFSSMAQRNEDYWEEATDPEFPDKLRADYRRADGRVGYAWMARYTLQFLNAYLKQDPGASAYLRKTPTQNGAPSHFMTANFRAAVGVPASLAGFRAEVGRRGFEHAEATYSEMRSTAPDFRLEEVALNDWAEELIDADRRQEAILLLSFNVSTFPDSRVAHANLGRACQVSGQHQRAIDCFRIALQKNRYGADVRRKLRRLENVAATERAAST
jgi:hypothetical protein